MDRIGAIQQSSIAEQTYYRWRKHYGDMGTGQLKEWKRLQKENEPLSKAVSHLTLDKLILAEAPRGKLLSSRASRHCIDRVCGQLKVSERRICRLLSQHQSTERHVPTG